MADSRKEHQPIITRQHGNLVQLKQLKPFKRCRLKDCAGDALKSWFGERSLTSINHSPHPRDGKSSVAKNRARYEELTFFILMGYFSTSCQNKAIKDAYHVVCQPCAQKKGICAKCLCESSSVESTGQRKDEDDLRNKKRQEFDLLLARLPERKRRTLF